MENKTMEPKYELGDKVWYRTVLAGTVKAKVVARTKNVYGGWNYVIKVTTRKNFAFYCGYTFIASDLHMWRR
jgi:hypothetical protein